MTLEFWECVDCSDKFDFLRDNCDNGQLSPGGQLEGQGHLLSYHSSHSPAKEPEVQGYEDHRCSANGAAARYSRLGEACPAAVSGAAYLGRRW